MALSKVICDQADATGNDSYISLAISLLEKDITRKVTNSNPDETSVPLLKFVIEQLKLAPQPKNGRSYFSQTIITAFLWP